ncbi:MULTISPECIES: hypothetical protein [Sphingomonas]|uniref:hypothetical protein n=1 Tax=Sphingomonas TaxID=13687 RepID=UPI000AC8DE04|nr:hypothetical protein [Sphingomonas sp. CCH10-B3]
MRQHALVRSAIALPHRAVPRQWRPRRRFASCTCHACRGTASGELRLSWRRRLTLIVAGLVVGQLLVIAIDRVIGGPGPFAWVALLFGKTLS